MSSVVKLISGLPTTVPAYDESIYYSSGLTASTAITLPSSGSFEDSSAKDILIILNDRVVEVTRDFNVLGGGPQYTQIEFIYDLPIDSVVRFKQNF